MREYILSVATAAIISALSEVLIPKNWQKYAGLLTGALLLLTLIKPLMSFRGIALPEFTVPQIEYTEYDTSSKVRNTLEENIEGDIKDRLKTEFKTVANADVRVSLDDDDKITGVLEIALDIRESQKISERLYEIYAPEKIRWRS